MISLSWHKDLLLCNSGVDTGDDQRSSELDLVKFPGYDTLAHPTLHLSMGSIVIYGRLHSSVKPCTAAYSALLTSVISWNFG